ncbi:MULTISPECIES: hypothetical protein [unclassified Mesorhizobium]|uniref:hypothetical protein n=1 Tax=unclassified Mesorhizobium TaxID=325217 RepID=UPI003335A0C5
MKKLLLASALGLATLGASPAFAAGAFDFLDPCIKAAGDFADQRQQVRAKYENLEGSIPTMVADAEFRDAWMKAKREQARPIFDAEVAPQLAKYGLKDMDQAFDAWFKDMIAAVDPQDLQNLINETYRMMAKEEVAQYRSKTEAGYDKAKSELDGSCKQDVGNQALRVVLAPIGIIGGNFEAAKDERNVVTQVFRAMTGISLKDIASHGILGGDNSELRKLVNGLVGGKNSEVNKFLQAPLGGGNSFFHKPFG